MTSWSLNCSRMSSHSGVGGSSGKTTQRERVSFTRSGRTSSERRTIVSKQASVLFHLGRVESFGRVDAVGLAEGGGGLRVREGHAGETVEVAAEAEASLPRRRRNYRIFLNLRLLARISMFGAFRASPISCGGLLWSVRFP